MKLLPAFFGLLLSFNLWAQPTYLLDLVHTKNDFVKVTIQLENISVQSLHFHFPKTVPGTYDVLDYGKYIRNFRAFDAQQQPLKVVALPPNTYKIMEAQNLSLIEYEVHDTYDTLVKENKIFEPAGTNILHERHYLLNMGGFIGFVEGTEDQPLTIRLLYPEKLEAFSAYPADFLPAKQHKMKQYAFPNYHVCIDNPIMVCALDTAEIYVQNTKVTIACYHEQGKPVASLVKQTLSNSMQALAAALPALPVSQYTFLLYIADQEQNFNILRGKGIFKKLKTYLMLSKMGFGALEHGQSSVYYLFDGGRNEFLQSLQEIAMHEFLHIFTPLSLHTEPIGNFNYIEPNFSQHLWLYEGSTEYHAWLIAIQQQLISLDAFFDDFLEDKLEEARGYPIRSMSFAKMSQNVMLPKYNKQYNHVYDLGALLCMALDIQILKLTQGKKNLLSVVLELVEKYGKNKNAPEETLIVEFVQLTHPEIHKFFEKHIFGNEYPDFEVILKEVGIVYAPTVYADVPIGIENGVVKHLPKGGFGSFQLGDKVSRNKIVQATYDKEGNLYAEGSKVEVTVERNGRPVPVIFPIIHKKGSYSFQLDNEATAEAKQLRKLWLKQ